MALVDGSLMTRKFRGCLLGSLMGDCLGFPYEFESASHKPSAVGLQTFFDTLESPTHKAPQLQYTDDTAMTICIAKSLIKKREVDVHDLAPRFVKEYYRGLHRSYGCHVGLVFAKLRDTNCKDPLGPAREQFGGGGSYGNGGAMRIAPIALFFRGQGTEVLGSMARKVTEVTHTHRDGINGAILQCLAVEQALWLDPNHPVDPGAFLEELITKMQLFEGKSDDESLDEESQPFTKRLRLVQRLLLGSDAIGDRDVRQGLGCGVSAITSVPTSIFCFLRAHCHESIEHIHTSNPHRRTLQYAISLGGDTDTIGAMSGALSGAALGFSGLDNQDPHFSAAVLRQCEGFKEVMSLADGLLAKSPAT